MLTKLDIDDNDIFFYYDTNEKRYGAVVSFCGEPNIRWKKTINLYPFFILNHKLFKSNFFTLFLLLIITYSSR